MFHINELCPICHAGAIGFRMCSNGTTVIMMCDECNAVWLRPDSVLSELAIFPKSPAYIVEEYQCSIDSVAGARWASKDEIMAAGFYNFIAGHGSSLSD